MSIRTQLAILKHPTDTAPLILGWCAFPEVPAAGSIIALGDQIRFVVGFRWEVHGIVPNPEPGAETMMVSEANLFLALADCPPQVWQNRQPAPTLLGVKGADVGALESAGVIKAGMMPKKVN